MKHGFRLIMLLMGIWVHNVGYTLDMTFYNNHSDYDFQSDEPIDKVNKTDEQWQSELPAAVYHITREAGTERAFTGEYDKHNEAGVYVCSNCGHELFSSRTKFDSGTGWPSYWSPISNVSVDLHTDYKLFFIERVEVVCNRCGAHLGHVFKDGPKDKTGLRYCINSLALDFKKQPKSADAE